MRWLIVVLGLLCLPAGVLAAADMQAWQAQMERRLTQLEQRVQEQDAVIDPANSRKASRPCSTTWLKSIDHLGHARQRC